MMNTDQHKASAHEFFARLSASDLSGALAMLTDDATWLIPGKPELMPTAGLYPKDRITRLLSGMVKQLQAGLAMTVKGVIAEGDKVAVEVESEGTLKNGRIYRQQYHFVMEFRDQKICAVREYLDTHHAFEIWIAPAEAPTAKTT